MTRNKKLAIGLIGLTLCLAASAVMAATTSLIDYTVRYMRGGAKVISSLQVGSTSTVETSGNAVTKMLAGNTGFDFAAADAGCEDSWAITVTGAAVGDPCMVGIGYGATMPTLHGNYECYVSTANAVKVRHCGAGVDDPADAGFFVRVISSQ